MHLCLHGREIQARKPVRLPFRSLGCTRHPLLQLSIIVQGLILSYKDNFRTTQGGGHLQKRNEQRHLMGNRTGGMLGK